MAAKMAAFTPRVVGNGWSGPLLWRLTLKSTEGIIIINEIVSGLALSLG